MQLCVRDNGSQPGSSVVPADPQEGHGLSFMRQRVRRWRGELTIESGRGGAGTAVRAEIPFRTLSFTDDEAPRTSERQDEDLL
ncbi:hypothetical protein [Nesterenkonia pannonica]|uniref:hypothetical protein n=1 Tax=Nesterenkonia pannonica TaxID=1548602 RepID=UPI00216462F8|nr:hypothetical protein [Nesterenkonia pannonica]